MPHFVIHCSENVMEHQPAEAIMQAVYEVAEATQLFKEGDIKVRLYPFRYYQLGKNKDEFIHVFAHIMEGRTTEQKANLSKKVIERVNEMFPEIPVLSINISEFELATYSNKSLINPLNTEGDRFFTDQRKA